MILYFCSFDNEGNANIFKILYKDNEDSIIVKKNSGNEIQCPIKYKNIINLIDNLTFTATLENKIYTYDPLYTKDSIQVIKPLYESYDGSYITFIKPFGKNSLESQKVIFGTEKEGINIYDQRMKKYSY